MAKPNVLILGGSGFIGRNLVMYLKTHDLAAKIRVADKQLPDLAGLSDAQRAVFKSDLVDFKQANLANPAQLPKVFAEDFGKWTYVVNLAAETKYSQTDEVYKEHIIDLTARCADEALTHGVSRWIEISTAQVYDAGKKPSDESSKIDPWTKLAKAKLGAEKSLQALGKLNYVVLRPAIVYGPGDTQGITPRLIIAAVYKQLGETMELLWGKGLKMHTVHVDDVVAAIWHSCISPSIKSGDIFNLTDDNDTDQGFVNSLLEQLFGIKTGFLGDMKSTLATTVAMKSVAETANDKHLKPWSDLCKQHNITNSPLTPYLDEELLYNNPLSLDGTKITKTGFTYRHPKMTADSLKQVIQYFVANKAFPTGLVV